MQEPGRLREVTGIGPKRAARIVAGWAEQKATRTRKPATKIRRGSQMYAAQSKSVTADRSCGLSSIPKRAARAARDQNQAEPASER